MKKNKNKPISIQFSFREKEVCTPYSGGGKSAPDVRVLYLGVYWPITTRLHCLHAVRGCQGMIDGQCKIDYRGGFAPQHERQILLSSWAVVLAERRLEHTESLHVFNPLSTTFTGCRREFKSNAVPACLEPTYNQAKMENEIYSTRVIDIFYATWRWYVVVCAYFLQKVLSTVEARSTSNGWGHQCIAVTTTSTTQLAPQPYLFFASRK